MVKKLLKHEFLFYGRLLGIVYIILMTVSAAGRIVQFFESDSLYYQIVSSISFLTYGVTVFATLGFTFALILVRFYKNLFTAEGYLTFTLPVSTTQHICVKAVAATCVELISSIVAVLSLAVMTSGAPLAGFMTELWSLLGDFFKNTGIHGPIICIEFAVVVLLIFFSDVLLYYVFICIGQLFRKNRILAAFGAYFVYYIASQIVSTIFSVVFTIFATSTAFDNFLFDFVRFAAEHPYLVLHSSIGIFVLIQSAVLLVEFFVIHRIISRKLNLE